MIRNDKMPPLWWLWVPLIFFIINLYIQIFSSNDFSNSLLREEGPYETVQALILAVCTIIAVSTIPMIQKLKTPWLTTWIWLAALSCFYICGEEISWGQHIFHWSTSADWAAINDHDETNLHNTTAWLDQHPRNLLEIGILTGGVIVPLLQKYKPGTVPEKFAIVYPPTFLWVTAALLWTIKLGKDIDGLFKWGHLERTSELTELYMYYFMLLYLICFRRRFTAMRTG